jgi:protein MpaA
MHRRDTKSARRRARSHPLWAGLFALAGCVTSEAVPQAPESEPPPQEPHSEPAPPGSTWLSAGESLQGRSIEYSVHGSGPLTTLLIASLHGDEAGGTPLLAHLHQLLESGGWSETMLNRRVVIVPLANPDGHASGSRGNSRGVDLNRNFPSTNFRPGRRHGPTPLSAPESRAIFDLIERYAPDRVLSFHMAADLIDYDGPGEALAREVARHAPMELSRMGSRPGSLGSYVGLDLQRPILTIELPASARHLSDDEAWQLYSPLIQAAIAFEE